METKRRSDEASAPIRSGAFSWGIPDSGCFSPSGESSHWVNLSYLGTSTEFDNEEQRREGKVSLRSGPRGKRGSYAPRMLFRRYHPKKCGWPTPEYLFRSATATVVSILRKCGESPHLINYFLIESRESAHLTNYSLI